MRTLKTVSTHEHDLLYVEVFGNHHWTRGWEFDTFADIRDAIPRRSPRLSGAMANCFNTFNVELVGHCVDVGKHGIIYTVDDLAIAQEYCRRLRQYGRWSYELVRKTHLRSLDVRLVRERKAVIVQEVYYAESG